MTLELEVADTTLCNGDTCTQAGEVGGRYLDRGKWRDVEQRSSESSDPPSSREDHMLLLQNSNDKSRNWVLMMHTWDRNYISGYSTWKGAPYGIQCQKS